MDLNGSVDKNSCHEDLSLKLQSPCKIQICSMSILNSVTLPGEGRQRQGEFPETQRPDGLAYYAEEKQQSQPQRRKGAELQRLSSDLHM